MKKRMLKDILFLDVETVSEKPHYTDLSERMQALWCTKARRINRNITLSDSDCRKLYSEKAAIYAEFNKVICISVGYLAYDTGKVVLKIKSFFGDQEKEILYEFSELINNHYNSVERYYLCGHNIKEFDCPVLCRRMLINDIELPKLLKISRKKSWQVGHLLDTLEMWKFGDYKSYISLDLLSAVLKVSSSKSDIDGSQVSQIYWNNNDIDRIKNYCEQDVLTTASVFLKLAQEQGVDDVYFISK